MLLDSTDGVRTWSTIGVSENIIDASWQALADSVVFGLLHGGDDGAAHEGGAVGADVAPQASPAAEER